MYAFRGGKWLQPQLPFSDPLLTPAHLQIAAAHAATALNRGSSQQQAEQVAEKKMYEAIYGAALGQSQASRVPRKEHGSPEHGKKEARVKEES
jgi:hypothetical protein